VQVIVLDPVVSQEEAATEYGLQLAAWEDIPIADTLVLAVAHKELMIRPQ
jgi:UDP-N-acetyl-D-galactosamine dehydrogenase